MNTAENIDIIISGTQSLLIKKDKQMKERIVKVIKNALLHSTDELPFDDIVFKYFKRNVFLGIKWTAGVCIPLTAIATALIIKYL